MNTLKRTSLPVFLLILLGVFACDLPAITPAANPVANATTVAQTLAAIIAATQAAANNVVVAATDTPASTPTLVSTSTPEPPTLTPTATLSPTVSPTVTSLVPMISVSVPTNCRVGPGKIYDNVGALLVGETVQVYGRDPGSNYWYIHNPDRPGEFCWVWGQYATITGVTSVVPVFTPPPTPTGTFTPTPAPGFDPAYGGLDTCSGGWWTDIELTNSGTVTFKSVSITIRDTVTSGLLVEINDGLVDRTGCNTNTRKQLPPGKTGIASAPVFGYNPTGHLLDATVTLCSNGGLNGLCVTRHLSFTP